MVLTKRFHWEKLRSFCYNLFLKTGIEKEHAEIIADSLIQANLRGVDSHGVVRILIYLKRIEKNMINPKAKIVIENESDSVILMDGNNQFGSVVATKALETSISLAKRYGVSLVGVKGSNHFGTGAYYALKAIKKDTILLVMSNASQTMPPTGGVRPFLGTNPLAVGVPTGEELPFVLDMATSVVARGKIIVASQNKEQIPVGWAIDKEGKPTTDPDAALEGSVLPVGGPKGYGISMLIDILAGVLTGAGYGKYVNNMYENWEKPQNVGHFFISIDINKFIPIEIFKHRMDNYIRELKSEPKAKGIKEILIPGELEYKRELERRKNGIPLPLELIKELEMIGKKYNLKIEEALLNN